MTRMCLFAQTRATLVMMSLATLVRRMPIAEWGTILRAIQSATQPIQDAEAVLLTRSV